jgi:hypothetical protein
MVLWILGMSPYPIFGTGWGCNLKSYEENTSSEVEMKDPVL